MKKIILSVLLGGLTTFVCAQGNYKTDFENKPTNTVEIMIGSSHVTIIGQSKNEITIESKGGDSNKPKLAEPDLPQVQSNESPAENPDRSKGLKPLTSSGTDNTNIGLTVEKKDGKFTVMNIATEALSNDFTFYIPDQVKLVINDMKPSMNTSYNIQKLKGEINISSLNSNFKVSDVSGPAVVQTTNGSVEIVYGDVTPNKPNSLTSVNGYVDVTLPPTVKADLSLNAVNGKAYTDFDIKTEKTEPTMPIAPHFEIFTLQGKINGGGVPFSISTVNGDIYLRKK